MSARSTPACGSPRPWRLALEDPKHGRAIVVAADGTRVAVCHFGGRAWASLTPTERENAALIVDAVNDLDSPEE